MISKDDVAHLAKLSRLRFSDSELNQFSHDLDEIFNFANMLQKIDTSGIEPSAQAIPIVNVMKEDKIIPFESVDALLQNAPEEEGHAFKVPKILVD